MAGNTLLNKEHPLAGVVLCFTSILPEQRTELATVASQMGATHKYDLTSDVTHLIVGEVGTPKYKFVARERSDVTVLKPEWIEAVRQSWMQGGDTDIRALEEQYKFPTFAGLSICITGFEDMAFRTNIQKMAIAHGAEFRKDLTKTVTHLVARTTEGEKYKFATQWNIKVVSVKWFNDSIERGMVLEETLYHPLLPPEQQGVGAWIRSMPAIKQKAAEPENSSNPRPRKLRRIASTKLGDQNEGIWGDIVGSGFDSIELKSSRNSQLKNDDIKPPRPASVIQEAKSFASETTFSEVQESRPPPAIQTAASRPGGFLDGCYFFIHGFSPKQVSVLRHHLRFNGAQLVDSLSQFSCPDIPKNGHGLYIIVPYKTPRSEIPSTHDLVFECEVVTDMWLERCLDAKTLVPPESHVASTPFPRFPIPGFDGMKICSTGFARIDLLHLSKLVSLMGASYDEYLTPSASVLICNDPRSASHEKLRHTYEWGLPAVSADWLWISIQTGQKKPFEPYIVQKPLSQNGKSQSGKSQNGIIAEKRPDPPSKQERQSGYLENSDENAQPRINSADIQPEKDKKTPVDPHPQKDNTRRKQTKPIVGDGFFKEPSETARKEKPISKFNSFSPTKDQNQSTTETSTKNRPGSSHSTSSAAPSAFDLALSGLLKQARAAKARSLAEPGEQNNNDTSRRRRRPLIGRANSTTDQSIFSRASSIDTLNEDGCGSAIESVNADGNLTTTARANSSRNGQQSFTSLLSGGKIDFTDDVYLYPHYEEEEDQTPAMTQLDYEDPDAAAMREKFLKSAGRIVNKRTPAEQGIIVGEVKELEDAGWGNGRRTRQATKVMEG